MEERGVIQNKDKALQVNNFDHLLYGKITPTDIDGLIELRNRAYVFIETKNDGAEIKPGQRLAIERLVKDLRTKKPTIALIARHHITPPNDIPTADCIVSEYIFNGEWVTTASNQTVKQWIDRFINKYVPECLTKL